VPQISNAPVINIQPATGTWLFNQYYYCPCFSPINHCTHLFDLTYWLDHSVGPPVNPDPMLKNLVGIYDNTPNLNFNTVSGNGGLATGNGGSVVITSGNPVTITGAPPTNISNIVKKLIKTKEPEEQKEVSLLSPNCVACGSLEKDRHKLGCPKNKK